ncbi:MAG: hypothetical protein BWY22_00213 [Bacteroidetes bacterium ADurb.Bin217]|nr:MAG: hypothetical protein BWY22_00213 [Bacteroidetes bacterium ADurb.Bin217]
MRFELLEGNEILLRKVIRIAQFESELDLGVNPRSLEQANTGYLTENDFEYIKRVCVLVEKRLKDSNWLKNTIESIHNKSELKIQTIRGLRFDDELFKAGRGILESIINEKYH